MPPRKSRKRRRKGLIDKDWKRADGTEALPGPVRKQVNEVFARLQIGESQREGFFGQRFSEAQRYALAYELEKQGCAYRDIATLLGVTHKGVHKLIDRQRIEMVMGLEPAWLPALFVDEIRNLQIDAAWNRARSEAAADDKAAATFRQGASMNSAKVAELALKYAESEALLKILRDQGEADARPDPADRVGTLHWVFENEILPKIEAPKPEEAEIVMSRSVQRRIAAQKGEPVPVFDGDDTDLDNTDDAQEFTVIGSESDKKILDV